jgi:hypothetical protein
MEIRDLTEDIKINRFKLEQECEIQPSLYHYWAEQEAESKAIVDRLKNKLKLVRAQVELNLRDSFAKKPTEAEITAHVERSPDVRETAEQLEHETAILYKMNAAVRALEHRKNELDNLTQLYIKAFYAKPDGGPRHTGVDEAAAGVRDRLNKKGVETDG